jgi:DNA-binding response OmpR family regulator
VKAQLRRAAGTMGNGKPEIFEAGSLKLDVRKHECLHNGTPVILTSIEFDILKMLIIHAGEVVRRDDLLDAAWGEDVVVTQRSVDTHIVNLRRKLKDDPKSHDLILSIRSLGYKLKTD